MVHNETALSININCWSHIVLLLISLFAIVILIRHFQTRNIKIDFWLKIFCIIPILTTIIDAVLVGFVFNNSVVQSSFLDTHCDIIAIIGTLLLHIGRYTTWIFYLYRLKYYFENVTKYMLTINIMIYSICTFLSMLLYYKFASSSPVSLTKVFIAIDDPSYKACLFDLEQMGMEIDILFIIMFIMNEAIISIYLLYLLYSKTIKFERDQQENQQLSIHFSERDTTQTVINAKIMRRCIFFGSLSLIFHWMGMILIIVLNIDIFVFCMIMNIISILVSFEIKNPIYLLCDCGSNEDQAHNISIPTPERINSEQQIELTESQNKYMAKIMKAYYA